MAVTLGTIEQFTGQDFDLYAEYSTANELGAIALKQDSSNKTDVEKKEESSTS